MKLFRSSGRFTARLLGLLFLGALRPTTELVRFVLDRKSIRASEPRLKATATREFLPRYDPMAKALAYSTFRIDRMMEEPIWELGKRFVGRAAGRSVKGRFDLPTRVYVEQDLQPLFDNWPRRHVNILGWPDEEAARLSIAQELRAAVVEMKAFVDCPSS